MYEYHCPECNSITEYLEEEANRNEPHLCSNCEGLANYMVSAAHLDYLHMGVDAIGNPTAGDKWARMHEQAGKTTHKEES